MKFYSLSLAFIISGCIYMPIPKDLPYNNRIGMMLSSYTPDWDGEIKGYPFGEKELVKVYELISQKLSQNNSIKEKYKSLEENGMYCMHFNKNSLVECRYKIYLIRPLKDLHIGNSPLLTISVFPKIGIESITFKIEDERIPRDSDRYKPLSREEAFGIMEKDRQTGERYK